ncbi:UTP--glucose-1-phosphate uridylyltransferase [bacterium HR24]|jgi:UTP--glucose-1-phosphate uridylyltransferase|nr:UTP--glucose-1-phosphate uridylyltransferase [bacterium HR24]
MSVRRGVILAAGFGTRFLPATKAIPKEMLPLLDRPVVQHIVEEAAAAGVRELVMVISPGKEALAQHFARSPELEQALQARGDGPKLAELERIAGLARIAFVYQEGRMGTGHALLQARWLLDGAPFALFYADDVVVADPPAIGQLVETHDRRGGPVLGLVEVEAEEVSRYGVIDGDEVGNDEFLVRSTVEKPETHEAPSRLAIIGRMVLTPDIFPALEETPPGRAGEIWLTDGLARVCGRRPVYGRRLSGRWLDTGNPAGLLEAGLWLASRDPGMSARLQRYLRALS